MKVGFNTISLAALALAAGLWLHGCNTDSFLNQSTVGRWEETPVILPILDRLDLIEEPEEGIPGLSQIQADDLKPDIRPYVLGPGDVVEVRVFELITPNQPSVQVRSVDEIGNIRLPVIGQIKASGLSTKQLEQRITDILQPNVIRDPQVSVILQQGRQNTFTIIGGVRGVGTYGLSKSDFRLLDAVALAGGLPGNVDTVYVIRQVPLSQDVEGVEFGEAAEPGAHEPPSPPAGERATPDADENAGDPDPGALIEDLADDQPADDATEDQNGGAGPPPGPGLDNALDDPPDDGDGRWVNIGGEWKRVERPAAGSTDRGPAPGPGVDAEADPRSPQELVTQRVIEIDADKLTQGVGWVNIVVRPGDVVRVPTRTGGNCYVGGEIARPGTYAVPGKNELTLTQLIKSAGGLSPLAVPERVDLRRRLDNDTEAILRLNYRAIAEGVQPNIYIKPHDEINIGTNLPTSFLAVVRNSFRFSYGFGFLLDRNFGPDVFGERNNNN